jgi:hypothetical protein
MFNPNVIEPVDGTPSLVFDAVLAEQHDATTVVTSHPVEKGEPIVDHVASEPLTYSVVGLMSTLANARRGVPTDIGITLPEPPFSLIGGLASLVGLATPRPSSVHVLAPASDTDPIQAMHDALEDIRSRGVECKVQTSTRVYESMVITKISMPRNHSGRAEISVDFRQIRKVSSLTVAAPKPRVVAGVPTASKGAQTPTEATPAQGPPSSVAAQLFL